MLRLFHYAKNIYLNLPYLIYGLKVQQITIERESCILYIYIFNKIKAHHMGFMGRDEQN